MLQHLNNTILKATLIAAVQIAPAMGAWGATHKASGLPMDCRSLSNLDLPKLPPLFENIKARMDDWPQLNYYSHANAQLAKPEPGKNRVVFMGDSIFEYWTNPKFGGFFPGKPYMSRGISGQATPQILLRLRADVIALKPKVMIVLAGINDIGGNTGPISLEQTQDNIACIAELAKIHGIKVILASLLPTSNYHFDGKDPRGPQTIKRPLEKIRALNDWLKQFCKEQGHVYLDYYAAMVDTKGMLKTHLSDDDLHPNKTGYALMVPLTEAAIATALNNVIR